MKRFGSALLLALTLALSPGCAVGLAPTVKQVVMQRHDLDCLVASIAMLGEWDYDDVELARRVLGFPFEPGGLTVGNGLKIMAALGKPGAYLKAPSLSEVPNPRGILVVSTPGQFSAHAVFIDHRGLIYDPLIPYAMSWVLWFHDRPASRIDGIVVIE